MKIDLSGKTAIVTGSIQGIGKEIATLLTACGASVIINNHRDAEELERVADEIRSNGGTVEAVLADITIKEQAQKLVDTALKFGSIDILVNNAGGLVKRVPVAEFDAEHFDKVFDKALSTPKLIILHPAFFILIIISSSKKSTLVAQVHSI